MKTENIEKWYVVRTKFKCERYVAENLEKKGVQSYLPLLTKIKHYKSKKKVYEVPLINCFVFVKISPLEFTKVLQTEYVFSFLEIGGIKSIVQDWEIELMQQVVGDFENVVVSDASCEIGQEMEIVSGQLTGVKGMVIEKRGKHNIILNVFSIGMQMSIEIDKKHLRPIASKGLSA